jgi:hypothetical protein
MTKSQHRGLLNCFVSSRRSLALVDSRVNTKYMHTGCFKLQASRRDSSPQRHLRAWIRRAHSCTHDVWRIIFDCHLLLGAQNIESPDGRPAHTLLVWLSRRCPQQFTFLGKASCPEKPPRAPSRPAFPDYAGAPTDGSG